MSLRTLACPSPPAARSPEQPARARLHLVFLSLLCSTQTDFHVQLSYRSLTSAWESFFSSLDLDLNSKSCALLRSA